MKILAYLLCSGVLLFGLPTHGSSQDGVDPDLVAAIVKQTINELAAQGYLKTPQEVTTKPREYRSTGPIDPESKNPVSSTPDFTTLEAKEVMPLPDGVVALPASRDSGLYVNVEAAILKARTNMGGPQNIDSVVGSADSAGRLTTIRRSEFDYKTAARVTAGYENEGKGFRMRSMQFSDSAGTSVFDADTRRGERPGTNTVTQAVGIDSYDFELTKRGEISDWKFLSSAGIRYAEVGNSIYNFNHANPAVEAEANTLDDDFDGWGVTGGLEGRYNFENLPITAVIRGRASILPMNLTRLTTQVRSNPATGAIIRSESLTNSSNQTVGVLEGFVGLESGVDTSFGFVTLNAGVESQRWINAAVQGGGNDQNDIFLSGFILGVGVDF